MTIEPLFPPGSDDAPLEIDRSALAEVRAPVASPRPVPADYRRQRERSLRAENNVRAAGALILLQGVAVLIALWTREAVNGLSQAALIGQTIVAVFVIVTGGALRQLKNWARQVASVGLLVWLIAKTLTMLTYGASYVYENGLAIGLALFSLYVLREPEAAPVFMPEYREVVMPATKDIKAGTAYARITLGLAVGFAILYAVLILFRDRLG